MAVSFYWGLAVNFWRWTDQLHSVGCGMLLTLLTAASLAQSPKYDVFLGMPDQMAESVRSTVNAMGDHWTPTVQQTVNIGTDRLVSWAWPLKGNHGIGLQIYGPNGKFKTRLEDSNIPSARAVVCQNRYLVGGDNTLRVWDAAQGYKLVRRLTFPTLGQFANQSCQGKLLSVLDSTKITRVLVPSLKPVDLRYGLSATTLKALNRSTMNHIDEAHTVTQTLTTPSGDTVVAWARTAAYDPKGPRSVGVQVYSSDGRFKSWLKDSAVERPLVRCGRYLVGGDNTLRVWDTATGFKQVARKAFNQGISGGQRELNCAGNNLRMTHSTIRLSLPSLEPLH